MDILELVQYMPPKAMAETLESLIENYEAEGDPKEDAMIMLLIDELEGHWSADEIHERLPGSGPWLNTAPSAT